MKRRTAALLLTLALAACATKPSAPVAPTKAEWDAVGAADYTCTQDQFVTADFDAVVKSPERYVEKCIRLRALITGVALVRDANSLKLPPEKIQTVGFYPKDETIFTPDLSKHPQFATLAGRLRSCAERSRLLVALGERAQAASLANRKPTDPIQVFLPGFMSGYCHRGGFALWANQVTLLPTAMD